MILIVVIVFIIIIITIILLLIIFIIIIIVVIVVVVVVVLMVTTLQYPSNEIGEGFFCPTACTQQPVRKGNSWTMQSELLVMKDGTISAFEKNVHQEPVCTQLN